MSRHRDSLTELGNRMVGLALLRRDLAGGRAGAFIYCDLDYFAAFNDANGHAQGDELLRLVADTLTPDAGNAAPYDAYRFGGDEFLIRVPDADLDTARALAEAARRRIKQLPAVLDATQPEERPLTARFAVGAWRAGQAPSDGELLAAAERVLANPAARDSVIPIEDDGHGGGGAGVREPRRPRPSAPSAANAVDP